MVPPLAGRRAVVVEDAPELAAELESLLSGEGMEVLTVRAADQVDAAFAGFDPQACLVDFDLRGGRGGEMLDLVGMLFPHAGAIILADDIERSGVTVATSLKPHAIEPLAKPVHPARLLGAVSRCVATYDAARERERASREIDTLRNQLAQASHTAQSVLSNLSHELRTPLNAIIGYSEMLQQGRLPTGDPERSRDYAASIHQSGVHMLGVVEDLLTMAALESGTQAIVPVSMDVEAAMEVVLGALLPEAQANGVQLTRRVAPTLPRLLADPALFGRALRGLTDNAVKFAAKRGKRVGLVARLTDLGGILVQVADNGPGIDDSIMQRLQKPFAIGEDVFARQHGGVGASLTIARKVMELHGGTLEMRSRPQIGTVVALTFPETRSLR